MTNYPSEDELKQMLRGIKLPSINVKGSVMSRIQDQRNGQRRMRMRNRYLITVLTAILLVTVGFTAMYTWELKGPGSMPFKYEILSKQSDFPAPEIYMAAYEQLSPGEALAIMKTKRNPNGTIHILNKSNTFTSFDALSKRVGGSFRYPADLPSGYLFQEGTIGYKYDDSYAEAMLHAAKDSSTEYIIEILQPTEDISHYSITYTRGASTLSVNAVFDYPLETIYDINTGQKTKIIQIRDFEAMLIESDAFYEIAWIDHTLGDATYYTIRSGDKGPDTIENMRILAESLKE